MGSCGLKVRGVGLVQRAGRFDPLDRQGKWRGKKRANENICPYLQLQRIVGKRPSPTRDSLLYRFFHNGNFYCSTCLHARGQIKSVISHVICNKPVSTVRCAPTCFSNYCLSLSHTGAPGNSANPRIATENVKGTSSQRLRCCPKDISEVSKLKKKIQPILHNVQRLVWANQHYIDTMSLKSHACWDWRSIKQRLPFS